MNILITGGAGYKGTVLSAQLLEIGHEVTVLDNFLYGFDSVLHLITNRRFHVSNKDIRNIEERDVKAFDVIYHLAGISGYPACEANPHSAQLINVEGSKRLTSILSRQQIIVYASTTSFYGNSGAICTESGSVHPISLYGITKYEAEKWIMQREHAVALRFATVFGVSPRMRIDLLVNDFTYKAVNERCIVLFESASKRTFVHIDDAISAYVFVLDHYGQMKGEIFNVGNNELNYSKGEIAESIRAVTNCSIIDSSMNDPDARNFEVSFQKIKALGYSTMKTLNDGICELTRLYEFYKPFAAYKAI